MQERFASLVDCWPTCSIMHHQLAVATAGFVRQRRLVIEGPVPETEKRASIEGIEKWADAGCRPPAADSWFQVQRSIPDSVLIP